MNEITSSLLLSGHNVVLVELWDGMVSTSGCNGSPVEFITHVPKMTINAACPANRFMSNDA